MLNGTKVSGLALLYLNRLSRDCLNVVFYGNASDRELQNTVIRYLPCEDAQEQRQLDNTLQIVKQLIDAPVIDSIPEEYLQGEKRAGSRIVIELGADYKQLTSPDPFSQLRYTTPVAPSTPEPQESDSTATTPETPLNSSHNQEASVDSTENRPEPDSLTPTPNSSSPISDPVPQP